MILLGNSVWEVISTELRPTYVQGARDGHYLKELDTGESYIRRYGIWEFVNLGLSFIKATKSGRIITDANGFYHVIFVTPFINDQYGVSISCEDRGEVKPVIVTEANKTINGFDIYTRNSKTGVVEGSIPVSWLATRHYNP